MSEKQMKEKFIARFRCSKQEEILEARRGKEVWEVFSKSRDDRALIKNTWGSERVWVEWTRALKRLYNW